VAVVLCAREALDHVAVVSNADTPPWSRRASAIQDFMLHVDPHNHIAIEHLDRDDAGSINHLP